MPLLCKGKRRALVYPGWRTGGDAVGGTGGTSHGRDPGGLCLCERDDVCGCN